MINIQSDTPYISKAVLRQWHNACEDTFRDMDFDFDFDDLEMELETLCRDGSCSDC